MIAVGGWVNDDIQHSTPCTSSLRIDIYESVSLFSFCSFVLVTERVIDREIAARCRSDHDCLQAMDDE